VTAEDAQKQEIKKTILEQGLSLFSGFGWGRTATPAEDAKPQE